MVGIGQGDKGLWKQEKEMANGPHPSNPFNPTPPANHHF
jgi:hypothetical protein